MAHAEGDKRLLKYTFSPPSSPLLSYDVETRAHAKRVSAAAFGVTRLGRKERGAEEDNNMYTVKAEEACRVR